MEAAKPRKPRGTKRIPRIKTYKTLENGEVVAGPRVGNPDFKPGVSGNPNGRPVGSKNKWSSDCLEILGLRSKAIINKVIEIALEDGHKEQGLMLKLCVERIIPQQKAIEVTGKNGQELSVKIIVDSVEHFNDHRIINGVTGELDE